MARRKNRFAGVLQPRPVGSGEPEIATLLLYDIENDRVRTRVSEICLDYGMQRIQFSAFLGKLSRNRRQELALRVQDEIGTELARVRIIPICREDVRAMWSLEQYGKLPEEMAAAPGRPSLRVVGGDEEEA